MFGCYKTIKLKIHLAKRVYRNDIISFNFLTQNIYLHFMHFKISVYISV